MRLAANRSGRAGGGPSIATLRYPSGRRPARSSARVDARTSGAIGRKCTRPMVPAGVAISRAGDNGPQARQLHPNGAPLMTDFSLEHPGGTLALSVHEAEEGPAGIEITKLLKETNSVTYDPGFVNTASCRSDITYIDGDAGILRYRGYPIDQLAEGASFLEVSYLLIYGELPTAQELENFSDKVRRHTMLHEEMKGFFGGFPSDAHPMPVLSSAVSALSTFYQDSLNPFDRDQVELSTVRLLAKLPTIAAYAYKKSVGQPFLYPDNSLGLVENFLRMTFGFPAEPYELDPDFVRALEVLLILHADHEQNCSTSTVRMVGSSQANLFASISAGINALFGPLHGGANQAVLEMLQR